MPSIRVTTNVELSDDQLPEHTRALSVLAAKITGKSEDYVLAIIEPGRSVTFGGTDEPAAYVEMGSLGMPEEDSASWARQICSFLDSTLDIPGERVYIRFESPPRHLFGWSGKTFG